MAEDSKPAQQGERHVIGLVLGGLATGLLTKFSTPDPTILGLVTPIAVGIERIIWYFWDKRQSRVVKKETQSQFMEAIESIEKEISNPNNTPEQKKKFVDMRHKVMQEKISHLIPYNQKLQTNGGNNSSNYNGDENIPRQ